MFSASVPAGAAVVLLQNEVPEAVNLAVARKAVAAGARVILNAAPARILSPDLAALIDIAMVNRVEAEALAGHSFSLVIETRGGEGAVAKYLEGGEIVIPAPKVAVAAV